MSKRKKCRRFIKDIPCVYRPMNICPKNANSKCEIVEPKYKRVKAWARWCVNNKKDGPWIEASSNPKGIKYPGGFECIITYKDKGKK